MAAKIANMKRGDNQHAKEHGQICPSSISDAAKALNVSPSSVKNAKRVLDKGAPAVVAAVESDKLALALEAILRPKAKENQKQSQGRGEKGSAKLPNLLAIDTRKEAAKVADWRFGCKRFAPAARRTGRGIVGGGVARL